MLDQTLAIFKAQYHELNSKKLFWITLILSGLVACVLLMIGITEDHTFRVLFWDTPIPLQEDTTLATMLKEWFVSFGIGFWLAWAATILAFVSTAGIFPDLVSSGSIDLVLSKPISRWRLFCTVYLAGLLFVTLQVGAFAIIAFAIIGIRSGDWEPGLLLAIPIVLLFFSYLFSVCTLVGVITKSTIAALLVTMLFWAVLFGINQVDEFLAIPRMAVEEHVAQLETSLTEARDGEDGEEIAVLEERLTAASETSETWTKWHGFIVLGKTVLPKTAETKDLLKRWLVSAANLPVDDSISRQDFPFMTQDQWRDGVRPAHIINRTDEYFRSRTVLWVIGTSVVFELIVLFLAMWRFCRRDF